MTRATGGGDGRSGITISSRRPGDISENSSAFSGRGSYRGEDILAEYKDYPRFEYREEPLARVRDRSIALLLTLLALSVLVGMASFHSFRRFPVNLHAPIELVSLLRWILRPGAESMKPPPPLGREDPRPQSGNIERTPRGASKDS